MTQIAHGGRLREAVRRHPDAPRPFIDLSTGINPAPYPFTPPDADTWQRLPEPEAVALLELAAAGAYAARDPAMVVAAPGTQALLQVLPRLFPQAQVTIPGPTYGEHAAAWRAAGAEVLPRGPAPAMVVCNPNNPDGARHDPVVLHQRSRSLKLLVVDEAFADFEPELSLVPHPPLPGVVVLRSFGKAYGLAGLRLGFAIAWPSVAARLRAALGPWAVSGPALAIGTEALLDTAWRAGAAELAQERAGRLDTLLRRAGLQPVGGTPLFRTVSSDDAAAVAERLAQAGILVRQFDHSPSWLRFGLPPDEEAWQRLRLALGA
jgi:cobalamin biosynthetic protein CobC